mgnify:CR=1 FL=1
MELESEAELYAKANELIEDIFRFKKEKCEGLSLVETIIEYGNQKEIPIQANLRTFLISFVIGIYFLIF